MNRWVEASTECWVPSSIALSLDIDSLAQSSLVFGQASGQQVPTLKDVNSHPQMFPLMLRKCKSSFSHSRCPYPQGLAQPQEQLFLTCCYSLFSPRQSGNVCCYGCLCKLLLMFSVSLQERPPKPEAPWLPLQMWFSCCDLEEFFPVFEGLTRNILLHPISVRLGKMTKSTVVEGEWVNRLLNSDFNSYIHPFSNVQTFCQKKKKLQDNHFYNILN